MDPVAQAVPVGLASGFPHLRMGLAGDHVLRFGTQVAEPAHRLDPPLDALARPDQSPGQHDRPRGAVGGVGPARDVRGAVRDHLHLARVDAIAGDEPVARGAGHGDGGGGQPDTDSST